MNEARYLHGCTTTIIKGQKIVLVAGGFDSSRLKTMEIYDSVNNEWKLLPALLPIPIFSLQVVHSRSLNYIAYVIGGSGQVYQTAIYGLNKTLQLEVVGNLKQKRANHASLNLRKSDVPGCK